MLALSLPIADARSRCLPAAFSRSRLNHQIKPEVERRPSDVSFSERWPRIQSDGLRAAPAQIHLHMSLTESQVIRDGLARIKCEKGASVTRTCLRAVYNGA